MIIFFHVINILSNGIDGDKEFYRTLYIKVLKLLYILQNMERIKSVIDCE